MATNGDGWWAGTTEEYMNIAGPLPTRDEAIAAGRDDQCGGPFWIVQAATYDWRPPDAESVLDMLADNSDEYFYEDGFPGFDGAPEEYEAAKADLNDALKSWMDRHKHILPNPTAFSGTSNLEQIDARPVAEAPPA